jgi:hypothetical protein
MVLGKIGVIHLKGFHLDLNSGRLSVHESFVGALILIKNSDTSTLHNSTMTTNSV